MKAHTLLEELITKSQSFIVLAETFQEMDLVQLNWKENKESWSVLECLEHLNLYGDFYLPELREKINRGNLHTEDYTFKSGWLGDYFATSMNSEKGMKKKMVTFKDKDPSNLRSKLSMLNLERFINQQKEIIELLNKAKSVNINKVRTGISISPLIRLKLGDTFRFVIYHNERHIIQAKRVLRSIPKIAMDTVLGV